MTTETSPSEAPTRAGPGDARAGAVAGLEGAFAELFSEFRRTFAHAAETASPGMLPATFKAFTTIDRHGPLSLSALAERLSTDKGQLSRNVSELEDLGFVERTPDPRDGRVRLIAVTPAGLERLTAARAPYQDRLSSVLARWPLDEIQNLTDLLLALTAGITPPNSDADVTPPRHGPA